MTRSDFKFILISLALTTMCFLSVEKAEGQAGNGGVQGPPAGGIQQMPAGVSRPQRIPPAVPPDVFKARVYSDSRYEHPLPYRLFIPDNYDPARVYPLVLFLHGAGERGDDNTVQVTANNGAAVWADPKNQATNPCFVLAPQCPKDEQWVDTPWELGSYSIDNVKVSDEILMVMDLINALKQEFSIDASRIYSTGLSMGGYGTWDINLRYPDVFAAALPVCGAGDPSRAALIINKPIWAFHGDQDKTVPVAAGREMFQALKAAGGNPKYSEYAGVGHFAWDPAYAEPELITWTFEQRLRPAAVNNRPQLTPEQIAQRQKDMLSRLQNDWASMTKYASENMNLKPAASNEKRIVFMGNSITEFWKTNDSSFFVGRQYINRGISGQTTPQMLVRFRQDVIDLKPEVVVILAGINDIAQNSGPITLEAIFGNIVSMAELAKANHIKVVLSSVLPANSISWRAGIEPADKVIQLNEMIKSYAGKNKIVYVDYYSPMVDDKKGLKSDFTSDGVHPNLAGYKVMEPLVEAAIKQALRKK